MNRYSIGDIVKSKIRYIKTQKGEFKFMLVCSYVPPREVRDERETVRLRASLVRMRT
jgi:hypothetical protein